MSRAWCYLYFIKLSYSPLSADSFHVIWHPPKTKEFSWSFPAKENFPMTQYLIISKEEHKKES